MDSPAPRAPLECALGLLPRISVKVLGHKGSSRLM